MLIEENSRCKEIEENERGRKEKRTGKRNSGFEIYIA